MRNILCREKEKQKKLRIRKNKEKLSCGKVRMGRSRQTFEIGTLLILESGPWDRWPRAEVTPAVTH